MNHRKLNPNAPVFATGVSNVQEEDGTIVRAAADGLSIREHFAIEILAGLAASFSPGMPVYAAQTAETAVAMADALVVALNGTSGTANA